MARRRFSRARRRIAKGKKDWVVGMWTQDLDQPVGATGTQFYTLIDEQELEEKDDKLTVLRVVGDIWTFPQSATGGSYNGAVRYWHGIKVFDLDSAGALLPMSPFDANDADADWMYLRTGFCALGPDFGDPAGANLHTTHFRSEHLYQNAGWGGEHIDIQVKRRLSARQVLILAMGAVGDNLFFERAATAVTHFGFVRVLVGNL